jgi:hypothetical protein
MSGAAVLHSRKNSRRTCGEGSELRGENKMSKKMITCLWFDHGKAGEHQLSGGGIKIRQFRCWLQTIYHEAFFSDPPPHIIKI